MTIVPDDFDDYWVNLLDQKTDGNDCDSAHDLNFETIKPVDPLDDQFETTVPLNVPILLRETLFGQTETMDDRAITTLNTFAVLDAAKVIGLPEILEVSGLEHDCLFQGDAAAELRDVAPWIVRLEEDHPFTRGLFTRGDGPQQLWDVEPGIYLRSQGSLEEVRKHLRKFTKVKDDNGRWYYIRFYDPKAAALLLDQVGYWKALLSFRHPQTLILRNSKTAWISMSIESGNAAKKELDFDLERRKEFDRKMKANARLAVLSLDVPTDKQRDAERAAMHCMHRMFSYGFKNTHHLRIMAAWELKFGVRYEEHDPTGALLSICRDTAPALRRFKKFSKRLDEVGFVPRLM